MSQNTQNNAPAPLNPIQTTALSLQHVVAMVVGCVTVPTIVSQAAGITGPDAVIMMQASLFVAAIAIFCSCIISGSGRFRFTGYCGLGLRIYRHNGIHCGQSLFGDILYARCTTRRCDCCHRRRTRI